MNDYTPDTDDVRDHYEMSASDACNGSCGARSHFAEFDRWFAEVERAAAEKAWDAAGESLARFWDNPAPIVAIAKDDNPYRKETP